MPGPHFCRNASPGHFPAGGWHDHTGSGDYILLHDVNPPSSQAQWRRCSKCQSLAWDGYSICLGGDSDSGHPHIGSSFYCLTQNEPNTPIGGDATNVTDFPTLETQPDPPPDRALDGRESMTIPEAVIIHCCMRWVSAKGRTIGPGAINVSYYGVAAR